jgi:hypothetical protein
MHTSRSYLGDATTATRNGDIACAARHQATAALRYHLGTLLIRKVPLGGSRLSKNAVKLLREAAPNLSVPAQSVRIPWRHTDTPSYLLEPEAPHLQRGPALVLHNGASTIKAKATGRTQPLIDAGLAAMTLDTPAAVNVPER